MGKLTAHAAPTSKLTLCWHLIRPLIPGSSKRKIRRLAQWYHSRHLKSDDMLLLSYPKSGSTWLRTLLAHVQSDGKANAQDLANWLPPLHMASAKTLAKPRIVRSHDIITTPGFEKAAKIVVLIRDPRALVVSYSAHEQRRNRAVSIEDAAEMILEDGFNDLGSWSEHASVVLEKNNSSNVLCVRYEDLRENTHQELLRILDFFEVSYTSEQVHSAIQASLPKAMKKMRENDGVENWPGGASDVRDVRVDKWLTECPVIVQTRLSSNLSSLLEKLGYRT